MLKAEQATNSNPMVEIIEFTDPVCTWCWGSEPALRALEARYGDQLAVKFIMGGLVKNIFEFYDSYNDIGGDPENTNKQVAKHWLEASERHGMPVQTEGFRLFSAEDTSTYPQNIAYKAVQMEDQGLADRFLRRMREATAAEALQTNKREVLLELASEVGVDLGQFLLHLENGSAEAAFQEDLSITRKYGVRGFPTFLIRYGEKEMLVRSFQDSATFESLIKSITGDEVKPQALAQTPEAVMQFVSHYGRVAPVELEVAFQFTRAEAEKIIEELAAQRQIKIVPAGNGFFLELVSAPLSCASDTGVCSI